MTGERRRVLLVEESEVIRLLTSHLLAAQQFEVIVLDLLPEDGPAQEYYRRCAAHGDSEAVHRL